MLIEMFQLLQNLGTLHITLLFNSSIILFHTVMIILYLLGCRELWFVQLYLMIGSELSFKFEGF